VTSTVHGPQVAIASFRDPSDSIPVRFTGYKRSRMAGVIPSRLSVLQAVLSEFEQEWPVAAASVEYVDVVSELSAGHHDDLALTDSRIFLGEVFSRIQLSRRLLTDSSLDKTLEDWSLRGDVVAAGLAGLIWHELAHVMLNTLVLRAEPRARSADHAAGLVIARAIGSTTSVAYRLAADLERGANRRGSS
jgi:hypothetical protein